MPANEPLQQLPYPTPSDPPDAPNDIRLLAEAVAPLTNMEFTDVPARDAALPTPTEGMEAFTGSGSSAVKWLYHNGDWRPMPIGVVAGKRTGTETQTIPDATVTTLNPGSTAVHYEGGIAGAPSGLSVPVAGWYSIQGGVRFASNSTGVRYIYIAVNGTETTMTQAVASGITPVRISGHEWLEAGDVVTLKVYQNSGSGLGTSSNFGYPFLSVVLEGRG